MDQSISDWCYHDVMVMSEDGEDEEEENISSPEREKRFCINLVYYTVHSINMLS